jgi:menaquinone-specific isochorismate synthase
VTANAAVQPALLSYTVALGEEVPWDPLDLVGNDGVLFDGPGLTLVGWGSAARPELSGGLLDPAGREALSTLLHDIAVHDEVDRPGTGPLALGALPFDRSAPGALCVPGVLLGRSDGLSWLTVVGPDATRPTAQEAEKLIRARRAEVGGLEVLPPVSLSCLEHRPGPNDYARAVARAVARIRAGKLRKVVLARCVDVTPVRVASPVALLRRLRSPEPSTTSFLVPVDDEHFVGASPELIVARRGRAVWCHPLAGTTGLAANPEAPSASDRLLGSPKELEEHRLVVDAVAEALLPRCDSLSVPDQPEVLRLATDARLSTRVEGRLAEGLPLPGVLELLADLHPTPAVGGVPRDEALRLIADAEPEPRGFWAGPVGWTDRSGNGDWVLGIRSVTMRTGYARVWAGAGIVSGSDPQAELAETTLKLGPVIDALSQDPGPGAV